MLGGFMVSHDEAMITDQIKRSSKRWKLLQYLIAHRGKLVPQDELIEVFFADEEVDNPGSALRTMVYRARAALAENGLPLADDMIVAKSGGYMWNPAISCTVDTEVFENLCKKAASSDGDEQLALLLQAARLYKGDFLPNSSGDMWVIPLARWYRSMYIKCVHEALVLLAGTTGRETEIDELCIKTLGFDPFDEMIIECHLRSLIAQGKKAEALKEYRRIEAMFYDVLGVKFSEALQMLYNDIYHPAVDESAPLEAMMKSWLVGADAPGAYYCDLSAFRVLFQIEARSVPRSGRLAFIVRIDTDPGTAPPSAAPGGVMDQLCALIPAALRIGDLYTYFDAGQFLLMLHSLTLENCKNLIDRILDSLSPENKPLIKGTSIVPVKALV